jgi:hypothetical protein
MTRKEICEAHAKNRAKLHKAITHLEIALNSAIRAGNKEQDYALVRLIAILRIAWVESSLACILHSKNVLTDNQVVFIRSLPSETSKWHGLCDFLFRLQYLGGKQKALNRLNLGVSTYNRFILLNEVLDKYIGPFIELRNKLAHGQWHIALTNDGTDKNPDMTSNVWTLSKKELLLIKTISQSTVRLFGMLIVGTKQFEADFDKVFARIELASVEIEKRYADAMDAMRRSVEARKRNSNEDANNNECSKAVAKRML